MGSYKIGAEVDDTGSGDQRERGAEDKALKFKCRICMQDVR